MTHRGHREKLSDHAETTYR